MPGRFTFQVQSHLARLDGYLYGGTAIAASMVSAEELTGRETVWMTTLFVATAPPGETVSIHAEILAAGRRTNQVRVTGIDGAGATMFASLGTTGHRRQGGIEGVFESMPEVTSPDDSPVLDGLFAKVMQNAGYDQMPPLPQKASFLSTMEMRDPEVRSHPDDGPGRLCVWVRRRDRRPITPAMVAYMADVVPLSVAHAAGVVAGGVSLDNSIRVGSHTDTEWVLLDLRPHMATGDYGHGVVHAWSEQGGLLATAGQSASMKNFDMDNLPWEQ